MGKFETGFCGILVIDVVLTFGFFLLFFSSHENHNGNHHRDNQGIQIHALNHIHHSQSKLNSITNTEMPQETGSKRISTGGVNGGIAQQQMSGSQTAVSVKRASEDTGAVPPSTKMPKLISEKS